MTALNELLMAYNESSVSIINSYSRNIKTTKQHQHRDKLTAHYHKRMMQKINRNKPRGKVFTRMLANNYWRPAC